MDTKRILFITSEISPYLPDSEIANICRALPQGIQERGREIRTFMPRYGNVNERRNQLHEVIRLSGMNLIIDDTDHPLIIKVASIQSARMQIYFIDNEDFFHRKFTFADDNGTEFEDNDERSIFYARGVLETVKKLRWNPDLIHCHGWISALVPLYIKKAFNEDPCYKNTKVVYSVYNDDFNVPFRDVFAKKLQLGSITPKDLTSIKGEVSYAALNKLAIDFADGIIQSSPTINTEVSEYATQSKKPFLGYQTEDIYMDAFNEFYDLVLSTATSSKK